MRRLKAVAVFLVGISIGNGALSDPLAPPPGLGADTLAAYEAGRLIFNGHWRPEGTEGPDDFDGLGPFYNRIACSSCHNAGGRGKPPGGPEDPFLTALVRIGVIEEDGSVSAHPVFGRQIQDRAIPGTEPEAKLSVTWEAIPGTYPDGTEYELRRPVLTITPDPGSDARWSIRVAQPLRGVGHFPHIVSPRKGHGLFGWKALEPTLPDQNAAAFSEDMGLTSLLRPEALCPEGTGVCGEDANEVGSIRLMELSLFTSLLPAPVQTLGKQSEEKLLFEEIGCASCHIPEVDLVDGSGILPLYSDLDLHPMGEGLDDGLPEGQASSDMWRTPPLWGLGTLLKTDPQTPLLHDGRARGAEEAILWHGGAAKESRERFLNLSAEDRDRLIRFLETL